MKTDEPYNLNSLHTQVKNVWLIALESLRTACNRV